MGQSILSIAFKKQSVRIVPSQKNSGDRSCKQWNCQQQQHEFLQNIDALEVSNQTSCVDIMTQNLAMTGKWVIRVHVQQGILFKMKRVGQNLCYQFPQGQLKMEDDRTGSVRDICLRLLSQSIAIDERFLCS